MLGAGIGCDTQGSSSSGPPRVSQPFGEDEHWSLLAAAAPEEAGWDTAINIVGSGDTIDAISIFSFGVLPDAGSTQLARGAQDPAGTVALTLHAGGKGQWTAEQESTPLRWEERSGAIWLHLKTGAVLVAQPNSAEKSIVLDLPGIGTLTLRKATP